MKDIRELHEMCCFVDLKTDLQELVYYTKAGPREVTPYARRNALIVYGAKMVVDYLNGHIDKEAFQAKLSYGVYMDIMKENGLKPEDYE